MISNAIISPCRTYRYMLSRRWVAEAKPGDTVAFVGLNPSTADATNDDPTIRRCIDFAQREGFASLIMLNLMAFRATEPSDVIFARSSGVDVVGPENDLYLTMFAKSCARVIACWGVNAISFGREEVVKAMLPGMWSFGTTQAGFPRHPLYLPKTAQLFPYN